MHKLQAQRPRLVVVTPAKNEANYIPKTIASMLKQTISPDFWLVIDDGSTDDTAQIVLQAAEGRPWIALMQNPVSGTRSVGLASVDAVTKLLAQPEVADFDYLCVLDADIELPPAYFEQILAEFERAPKLGIAAGQVYERSSSGKLVPMRGAPEATSGAVKCWRRQCFEQIGGLINEAGWDGIDQYQAAFCGWTTRTFDREGINVLHLRQMGSSHKSILHGRVRRGRSGHFMGSHPLWMIASTLFHLRDSPFVLASAATLVGYFGAGWRRAPQVNNPALIQFIRYRQMSKLRSMCSSSLIRRKTSELENILWQQQ